MGVSIRKVYQGRYEIIDGNYKYEFNHIINNKTRENEYRIVKLKKGSIVLTNSGNWEKAFALKNHELVGGMHGHERYTKILIYQDNKFIKIWDDTKTYTGNKIVISQYSNFYNPNMKNQIICKAHTIYTFENKKLTINTIYQWKISYPINIFFTGMLPSNNKIFVHGQIEGYSEQELVDNGGIFTTEKRSNKGTVWTSGNAIRMTVETSVVGPAWIRTNNMYNKVYLTSVYNDREIKPKIGEHWAINTIYTLS